MSLPVSVEYGVLVVAGGTKNEFAKGSERSDVMHRTVSPPEPKSEPGRAAADRLSVTTGAKSTPERPSTVFVELNTRTSGGFTVSLDWDRDTGQTQIVIHDARTATQTVLAFQAPMPPTRFAICSGTRHELDRPPRRARLPTGGTAPACSHAEGADLDADGRRSDDHAEWPARRVACRARLHRARVRPTRPRQRARVGRSERIALLVPASRNQQYTVGVAA